MKLTRSLCRRNSHASQDGYVLLILLIFLTLLIIAATAVAPTIKSQIRREREQELIRRGQQYARAIKRFYAKFGRYPNRLDELEDTNNLRFLRRRYKDPMTAEGQWRIIHVGESKYPPQGFGIPARVPGSPAGGLRPAAASPAAPASPAEPTATSAGPSENQPGTPAQKLGTLQSGGPTFGGAPIIGVASTSEQESIKEYNARNHYNEWEFIYDPQLDPATLAARQAQRGKTQPGQQPGPSGTQPQPPPSTSPTPR
ncbi:MAG TPA: hypothetical protein VGQ71_10330 [Terriglobales bacterium]|nr:hypothetical protein [Terriglobales bacterium]